MLSILMALVACNTNAGSSNMDTGGGSVGATPEPTVTLQMLEEAEAETEVEVEAEPEEPEVEEYKPETIACDDEDGNGLDLTPFWPHDRQDWTTLYYSDPVPLTRTTTKTKKVEVEGILLESKDENEDETVTATFARGTELQLQLRGVTCDENGHLATMRGGEVETLDMRCYRVDMGIESVPEDDVLEQMDCTDELAIARCEREYVELDIEVKEDETVRQRFARCDHFRGHFPE